MAGEKILKKMQNPESCRPVIIAGPCSAETPGQLMAAAGALKRSGNVDYFRAGLWKPRTSPDSFQGVGGEGLEWLKMVRRETGMKVATEVGCPKHVDEALKYDIDLLWIGARTVSNPFVVQEIAETLRGVDIPVLVKNPLNPDLELWYGAINRFLKVGIKDVGAIHRGFSIWGKSVYRNPPIWEIPNALRERMPGILLINDPSHICGKRSLIPLVAGRALDGGAGGLMVEVHPEPARAMSDAAQQLDPAAFSELLKDLGIDKNSVKRSGFSPLDDLSTEIDMVDELIVHTIASRMELSRHIESIKESGNSDYHHSPVWQKGLKRVLGLATEDGLRPGFIHKLFNDIFRESHYTKFPCSGVPDK